MKRCRRGRARRLRGQTQAALRAYVLPNDCRSTRHRDHHERANEAHWYGHPSQLTDARCDRRRAPTMLLTTRRPPEQHESGILSRTDALGRYRVN
ncbi:hypothetical protein EVAR_75359_1 [Eumeta japonica]|uniref:Uncharacterized protein n=1 Tax=Eumeta variegata TaxID=151549 RepID=A0A4C1YCG0_EUMVA|nr:hypothetical protein EVAR_75359_1 [Eumeta japonica]